ncbi:RmlC-like cupins superfamily protein [Striga asiatica]|uniref:Germin-like protein n=1 Tax=Striga asiatica TaxID=4170 RepID=A0A5A7P2R5_STRAF|nr:RmlC-like cupins superfamily protein [Striga asiatica]
MAPKTNPQNSTPTTPILTTLLTTLILILSQTPTHRAADPDPLQDFCVASSTTASFQINGFPCKNRSKVTSDDFFFHGFTHEGNTSNPFGSNITSGNVLSFPGLNTLGLSMNRVDLRVGGINPPHVHPRATETGVVIKGKVLVGFLSSDNKLYMKNLSEWDMFVAPRGTVHFQMNVGKSKATLVTAFNSQLPGAVVVSTNLFDSEPAVPDMVLEKGFRVGKKVVDEIKSRF